MSFICGKEQPLLGCFHPSCKLENMLRARHIREDELNLGAFVRSEWTARLIASQG